MSGSLHPIDAVIVDDADVAKNDTRAYFKARTPLVLADAAEINTTDITGQEFVSLKSTGRAYARDTADTTTADDGDTCIRDAAGTAYKKQLVSGIDGEDGADGADGTDPGILLTWDEGNSDADPGTGKIRADDDDLSAAAFLYVSKTNRAGDDISSFLSSLGDADNTIKGHLILTRPGGNAQAILNVTGITDASGYVKVAVAAHSGASGFTAGAISFQFSRSGDKGADGAASSTPGIYQTRAALAAATVPAGVDIIQVFRHGTSTKAAPSYYERLGSTPSPVKAWHAADSTSAYFFMRTPRACPDMFGAIGDGSTDDSVALQAVVDYALAQTAWVELPRFYASSTIITKPNGTDPGALIIEGAGFDISGITFTGGTHGIYCPATGTNRNVGHRFSNFRISGSNTGLVGIYATNTLNCVYDMLHIVGFCNHAIYMGKTIGYGHLRVTIRDCKTSPSNNYSAIISGARAVMLDAGNYCTLRDNYFSGYINPSHTLDLLVDTTADSTLMMGNILETTLHGVRIAGASFGSFSDKPVGSTISGRHFIVDGNREATIITPRGTAKGDIDVSGADTGLLNVILEGEGRVYP